MKKLLSVVLVISMLFSLAVPFTAAADEVADNRQAILNERPMTYVDIASNVSNTSTTYPQPDFRDNFKTFATMAAVSGVPF